MTTIPACVNCKHYYSPSTEDALFKLHLCEYHYFEKPNYLTGEVALICHDCYDARQDENMCGYEAKNFEQREEPFTYEPPKSTWWHIKQFVKMFL
jgi:hypothetical protein